MTEQKTKAAAEPPLDCRVRRLRYTCHVCGKKGSAKADELIEQAFTGRRFCSAACWGKHVRSKGF